MKLSKLREFGKTLKGESIAPMGLDTKISDYFDVAGGTRIRHIIELLVRHGILKQPGYDGRWRVIKDEQPVQDDEDETDKLLEGASELNRSSSTSCVRNWLGIHSREDGPRPAGHRRRIQKSQGDD